MKEQWIAVSVLMSTLHIVNVQFMPFPPPSPPAYMPGPPPPYPAPFPPPPYPPFPPFPPPVQVMYPAFALKIPDPNGGDQTTTTTTTTTSSTESNIAIAIPMPLPMPVQVAVPAGFPPGPCQASNRPPGCPPCPPCVCEPACTPSFFAYCSPCHQKCRCRSPNDYPVPIPPQPPVPIPGPAYPVPMGPAGPPPVVVYPFPPGMFPRSRPSKPQDDSCESSSDDCSYNSCSKETRHNRKKKMLRKIAKRRWNHNMFADELKPKPVLSYVSEDGKVHLHRRISEDDAIHLLNSRKEHQTVEVSAGEDSDKRQRVVVATEQKEVAVMRDGARHMNMRTAERKMVGDGRKQLVFRPPDNKRISNLSVIFEVS